MSTLISEQHSAVNGVILESSVISLKEIPLSNRTFPGGFDFRIFRTNSASFAD
jgi:hypothetical protein